MMLNINLLEVSVGKVVIIGILIRKMGHGADGARPGELFLQAYTRESAFTKI